MFNPIVAAEKWLGDIGEKPHFDKQNWQNATAQPLFGIVFGKVNQS
jgi:hypothetical protein